MPRSKTPRKRASYSSAFKTKVISVAELVGNREAARKFNVPEANVRDWRKSKEKLLRENPHARASGRGKVAQYPELEKELSEIVAERRASGYAISTVELRCQALKIMKDKGNHDFKASGRWCQLFMRRHDLCVRHRFHSTSNAGLPTSIQDKLMQYQQFVAQLRTRHGYDDSCVAAADQTALMFDLPCFRTIDRRGTGNEQNHFTVMLGAYADGTKMNPYVVFKDALPEKCRWPSGVVVRCHPSGCMDEALTQDWFRSVWCENQTIGRKMLTLPCWCIRTPAIEKMLTETSTDMVLTPSGLTEQTQVVSVPCDGRFKLHLRQKWSKWMNSRSVRGEARKPNLVQIAAWIKEAWEGVSPHLISRGFQKCSLTDKVVKEEPDSDEGHRLDLLSESDDQSDSSPEDFLAEDSLYLQS